MSWVYQPLTPSAAQLLAGGGTTYEMYAADVLNMTEGDRETATFPQLLSDLLNLLDTSGSSVELGIDGALWKIFKHPNMLHWYRDQPNVEGSYQSFVAGVMAAVYEGFAADALGLSDSAGRTINALRYAAEQMILADGSAEVINAVRALSDQLTLSDGAAETTTFVRHGSDALTVIDGSAEAANFVRSMADALNLSDGSIGALEAVSAGIWRTLFSPRMLHWYRNTEANVGGSFQSFVAGLVGTIYSAFLADALGFSDGASRTLEAIRYVSEQLNLSDGSAEVRTAVRYLADQIALSDGSASSKELVRYAAESLNVLDGSLENLAAVRAASDVLNFADGALENTEFAKYASDSLSLSDNSASYILGDVTGSIWRMLRRVIYWVETMPGAAAIYTRYCADVMNFMDSVMEMAEFARAASDNIVFSEGAAAFMAGVAVGYSVDVLNLTDGSAETATFPEQDSDAMTVSDTSGRWPTFMRPTAEQLALSEGSFEWGAYARSAWELLDLSDIAGRLLDVTRFNAEQMVLIDGSSCATATFTIPHKYWWAGPQVGGWSART